MIADYYTKPLHGALFRKMRDIVMGLTIFPDDERVNLSENVSEKAPVEYSGTEGATVKNNKNRPIIVAEKKTISYADVVRTDQIQYR